MYEINLKIHEEEELYSPYDESRRTLSSDVSDYLAGQYGKKDTDDEIILKIKCDGAVDRERVCGAFQELIREQKVHNANQKRINRIKQLWLFCIGVVVCGGCNTAGRRYRLGVCGAYIYRRLVCGVGGGEHMDS